MLGDFALLPIVTFPSGSATAGSGTGTIDATLLLLSSRNLGVVHLDMNLGVTWRSGNGSLAPTSASLWRAAFSGTLQGPLAWAVEVHGFPGTTGPAGSGTTIGLFADVGYTVSPSLVLDFGSIVPVNGGQPRSLYAGLTWNAGKLW